MIGFSETHFAFTPEGYAFFMEHGGLPIGIMSLAFPLGGIFGLVHKSKQLSQQLLNEKLRDLRNESLKTSASTDAILILVYRRSNHVTFLNNSLLHDMRNAEHIRKMLATVVSEWSLFYTEERFYPAIGALASKFNSVDAFMCGYERGIVERVLPSGATLTNEDCARLIQDLDSLENSVIEYRKSISLQYERDFDSICSSYGFWR